MSNSLIKDEEFMQIKKELDDILREIDELASPWIDLGNAVAGIGLISAFLINPLVGLGAAAAGWFFSNAKKEEALENKRQVFYEALPRLQKSARVKIPAIEHTINILDNNISFIENTMLNDAKLIVTENNVQNKEYLINGLASSFKAYCRFNYMQELYEYALDTYKAWLNEEYSAGYQCPNINNSNRECAKVLYKNSDFSTVISENPSIGSLLILDNNNDDDIRFLSQTISEEVYRRYKEDYMNYTFNDILFVHRENEKLIHTKLLSDYDNHRYNEVERSLYDHYDKMPMFLFLTPIVSFIALIIAGWGEKDVGFLKYLFILISCSALITGIIAAIWVVSYYFLFNIRYRFYKSNKVKGIIYFIILIVLVCSIFFIFNKVSSLKIYNQNTYNQDTLENKLLEKGINYYNNDNYKEAIKWFKKATELYPNYYLNWHWLGSTYNQNGNYKRAIRCLKKAVELNSNNYLNWHWLGSSYNQNGEYQEAIRCLKKAVELEPNDANNWYWLGASYNQNGEYQEAIRCLKKAVELEPNDANNLHWLGRSYNQNGDYQEAIRYLKKVAELKPDRAGNWNWLGSSYNKNGNYEEAIQCLKKAAELKPDDYSNWHWLGISYNENGDYKEAIQCLKKAVELKPDDYSNWNWLGASYNQNGEYLEAIRCLKKAVELKHDNQSNWRWLGRSYNGNGDYKEAIRCLKKAVELDPDNANSWEWLGDSYSKNEQFKEAQNAYAKALEIEPDNDYYKEQFKLNGDKVNGR